MSRGTIYVATGSKYVEEACQSAASLKAQMPHMPITVFSDAPVKSPHFDDVVIVENLATHSKQLSKVSYIKRSPYQETLFLDADTFVCGDVSELFEILERFDLAVAHAPTRIPKYIPDDALTIPRSFPQMNTGVIVFKRSPQVDAFFSDWLRLYQLGNYRRDQWSFREALYNSALRVATLTPEYNCRLVYPVFVAGVVKILHARRPDLPGVARKINRETTRRVFESGVFQPLAKRLPKKLRKLLAILRNRAGEPTAPVAAKYLGHRP